LDKKIAGLADEEKLSYFSNLYTNAISKKKDMLKWINQRYTNKYVDEMLDKIEWYVKKEQWDLRVDDFNRLTQRVQELKNKKALTLSEQSEVLKEFDNWRSLYDAKSRVKWWGENKSLASLRDDVLESITKEQKSFE